MKLHEYIIIIAWCFAVALWVMDKVDHRYETRQNTQARQAPLNIYVTGPYTTIIKTPTELLLVEGEKGGKGE